MSYSYDKNVMNNADVVKKRATRPDRAQKLLERKENDETIIKKCLQRSIIPQDLKNDIVQEIRKRVQACSQRTVLVSLALNLIVQEAYDADRLHDAVLPDFWDVTFMRRLFLGSKKDAIVSSLFDRYPHLLHSSSDRQTGDGNIYTSAAIKFSTNVTNHIRLNTPMMIKNVLYQSLSKPQAMLAFYAVHGWIRNSKAAEPEAEQTLKPTKKKAAKAKETVMSEVTKLLVQDCRNALQLSDVEVMNKSWFKGDRNLRRMLDFRIFAIRKLDILSKEKIKTLVEQGLPVYDPKLYSLLPVCRTKAHFIQIDRMGFWGLCVDLKLTEVHIDDKIQYVEETNRLWKEVFKTSFPDLQNGEPESRRKSKKFTGTIDTDGVVINVHYSCSKKDKTGEVALDENGNPKKYVPDLKTDRVLGLDPGRVNIYFIAEELDDGSYRTYKLSRAQYYRESGSKAATEKSNKWNLCVKKQLEALSKVSAKGISLPRFLKYLEVFMSVKGGLWLEYFKDRWARQRLRTHGGKKKVFARFLNRVEKDTEQGKRVVIAYGSAKFAPGGKGEVSAPTSRAYKECCYRFLTIYVDEFRTTRIYFKDGETLLKAVGRYAPGSCRLEKVRGLLWFSTKDGALGHQTGKFVDRDLNGALNIKNCLTKRPKMLIRKKDDALPKQYIAILLYESRKDKKEKNRMTAGYQARSLRNGTSHPIRHNGFNQPGFLPYTLIGFNARQQ